VPISVISASVSRRMSISEAQSCKPMCMITPPGLIASNAALRVTLAPTASITWSNAPAAVASTAGS